MRLKKGIKILAGHEDGILAYLIFNGLKVITSEEAWERSMTGELEAGVAVRGPSKELVLLAKEVSGLVMWPKEKTASADLKKLGVELNLWPAKPSAELARKWLEHYGLGVQYAGQLAHLTELELVDVMNTARASGGYLVLQPRVPTPTLTVEAINNRQCPLPGWTEMGDDWWFFLHNIRMTPNSNSILAMVPRLKMEHAAVMAAYVTLVYGGPAPHAQLQ